MSGKEHRAGRAREFCCGLLCGDYGRIQLKKPTTPSSTCRTSISTVKGKIDYRKFKPALFQFPTYEYLETGEVLGSCMKMN